MVNLAKMPELKIADLTARVPVIQGGMGVGISLAELVASVINAGGLGVLAGAGIGINEPDYFTNYNRASLMGLVHQVLKVRELTDGKGPVAVNIMASLSNYEAMIRIADLVGVDIVFVGGGFPQDLPRLLIPGSKMRLVPIVSSGKAARILCKRWTERYNRLPDAIVVEGPKAGGHLGFKLEQIDDSDYALEKLVPEVIVALKPYESSYGFNVPVIAAGGVYTGADIARFLTLGAAGVQMGTRFVTTRECNASDSFKQAYLDCSEEDLIIIKSPVGMPGRAIRNQFLDDVAAGRKQPSKCPYHCIRSCAREDAPYCIFFALGNAYKGRMNLGFAFAGANAWRATEIITVHELMTELMREYEEAT